MVILVSILWLQSDILAKSNPGEERVCQAHNSRLQSIGSGTPAASHTTSVKTDGPALPVASVHSRTLQGVASGMAVT